MCPGGVPDGAVQNREQEKISGSMNFMHAKRDTVSEANSLVRGASMFFANAFRPFFLFAGAYAVLAMSAWLIWLWLHDNNAIVLSPSFATAPHLWHGHEMLFGYGGAVITGFLLTAVPNWTGAPVISGRLLGFLAAIWLLGRFAVWFSSVIPPLAVAIIDLAHPVLLMCIVGSMLSRKPVARNLVFLMILLLLLFANAAVHAEWLGWFRDTASWGLSLAVYLFSMMIVVIGGRVVPAFTRNAMMKRGQSNALPTSFRLIDGAAIALPAALVVAHLLSASPETVGLLAAAAALMNGIRLVFWRGHAMLNQPIVWSLHLGYLFTVLGFAALALSGAGLLGAVAAQHVLAVGAVGCMTLAVMTRASLGHSGRPLRVNRSTAISYVLIALSALVRASAPGALHVSYFTLMYVAGALWIAGFVLFLISYAPILLKPSEEFQIEN